MTYSKLLIMVGLPLLCGVVSYISWYFILKRQGQIKGASGKDGEKIYTRFISTLVILLFFVHPQIT